MSTSEPEQLAVVEVSQVSLPTTPSIEVVPADHLQALSETVFEQARTGTPGGGMTLERVIRGNLPVLPPDVEKLRASLMVGDPLTVDFLNLLMYADPGVGKTFFVGTANESDITRPLLIFDCDGGTRTVRHQRGIDVVQVRTIDQLEAAYNILYRSIRSDGTMYYKTVAIDTATELADLDMRIIMKNTYAAKPETTDIDVPSPREWGKNRNHIRLLIRGFRDLPCNTIICTHVGRKQNADDSERMFPGFAGKLGHEIPGFMDIVGLYTQNPGPGNTVTRKLQVQGTRRVMAKDRTSSLSAVVDNPTIPMLWEMIQGYDRDAALALRQQEENEMEPVQL